MTRRRRKRTQARGAWWLWGGGAAAIVVLATIGWFVLGRGGLETGGEAGTPLTTLVGRPAPVLEFPDADGERHRVPRAGTPTVIIFHMGLH